jgi:hypothetical protein
MIKLQIAFVTLVLCAVVSSAQRPMGTVKIWNPAEGGAASGTVKVDGLNSTMIGAVDRQDGFATNLTVYSNLVLNGQTRVDWDEYSYNVFTPYGKFHRVSTNTFSTTGVWETISFDSSPVLENSFGIDLVSSNTLTFAFTGLVQINGCLRPTWLGNNNEAATIYSRIVWSTNNWATTNEARCLQSELTRVRQGGEGDTLAYRGSLFVTPQTEVRLQSKVTSTELVLGLHTAFDNPTSASINLYSTGR